MTWLVEVSHDNFVQVTGQLVIENGALIFYDKAGRISVAYGRRAWLTVTTAEDA